MRVLITGATGFIGSTLTRHLVAAGHEVWALSRDAERARRQVPELTRAFDWQPKQAAVDARAFAGVDGVVHLAGESVAGRWGDEQRRAIRDSRVLGTRHLVEGMRAAEARPRVLVSSSAVGYYGDRGDEELTEESAPGDDFLANVGKEWEAEARKAETLGVTVIRIRTGIVLGHGGGALQEMLLPAKLGLGGPLGSGRQWWSWIHLQDVLGIIEHALGLQTSQALNNTAPEPVRQKEFARALGQVLHRPAFAPAPAFALRLILGGFANELLSSKKVLPAATLASGYSFRFPELDGALQDLLG